MTSFPTISPELYKVPYVCYGQIAYEASIDGSRDPLPWNKLDLHVRLYWIGISHAVLKEAVNRMNAPVAQLADAQDLKSCTR